MSQTEKLLELLKRPQGVSSLEAMQEAGCFRLSAVINELRNKGYDIINSREKINGKYFVRYRLDEEQ